MFNIEEELKKLPDKPGVYLMHDETDRIIYVGKAKILRNRVRQYFQTSRNKGPKIEQMVTHIRRFEYIVTDTEAEALVLECNLIKEHRPKYNTMLMDDKTYPFIRITTGERFPRIMMSRRIENSRSGSKYFGPYPNAGAVKEIIELLRKLYQIRSCGRNLPADIGRDRPCLNYHIHQCKAPCQGYISEEEYRENISRAIDFLNGHDKEVVKEITARMMEASENLEFEKAQEYKDLLESIGHVTQKQKITSGRGGDRDVIALAMGVENAIAAAFFIRGGKILGRDHFYLSTMDGDTMAEVLTSFIKQYYSGTPYIPHEIMIPIPIPEAKEIEEWLGEKAGHVVRILVPVKGSKEKLVELAQTNARMVLDKDSDRLRREYDKTKGAVREITDLIGIGSVSRIEAYDISNTAGFESVGSMVVYENGLPKRNDYRKFKIKTIEGPDDYGSMREVLTRRFSHGLAEQKGERTGGFSDFPELILMDGGKGQVHAAEEVLAFLGIVIPVCGMVKDDHHRTRGLLYQDREIPIGRDSEGFKLITRIQDEAHRFAITYHRSRRGKAQVHSILDDIPNIGPARRKALRQHYASPEEIREASLEELKEIPELNAKAAESVYNFFHKDLINRRETDEASETEERTARADS